MQPVVGSPLCSRQARFRLFHPHSTAGDARVSARLGKTVEALAAESEEIEAARKAILATEADLERVSYAFAVLFPRP